MSPAEAILLIAVGAIIGAYATSIGAGGGFLIAPLLLLRYPEAEPAEVTTASLTVVLISSLTSTVIVSRERRVPCYAVAKAPASVGSASGYVSSGNPDRRSSG